MKKLFIKLWPPLLILILGLLISWPLFRAGYFSHQDDLQIIRLFEMRKCFADLQIPCRWVPDMGWGNGVPLYNFYGVFSYYLGAVMTYVVGYINSAKILFFVALIMGSFGIYLLVKDLWGRFPGLTAAVLYLYAPYKALDIYVRGALAESVALSLIPFVFYFGYKLIKANRKKYFVLFTLTLSLFAITHNIMPLLFTPVLLLWLIYWLVVFKWKNLKNVILVVALGFSLAAFFVVPAFFEKNLIQSESLTRFELDFKANYVKVAQLFIDRSWGYGTSIPGPEGGMSFQIGWPHWWLVIVALVLLAFSKAKKSMKVLVVAIVLTFLLSILMTHNKSAFIWVRIPILKYFQFPWRFLSLSIFTAAILGGFVISELKGKWRMIATIVVILLAVLFNWSYFRPKEFYSVTDAQKLSGAAWDLQTRGALLDYLPKTALEPRRTAEPSPLIKSGQARITDFVKKSNQWSFEADITTKSDFEIPVFYFPDWQVSVDGKEYPFSYQNYLGRIGITLEPGSHIVKGYFASTPIRKAGNIITLISLAGFLGLLIYDGKNKKIFR